MAPTGRAAYEGVFGPDPQRLSRWRISPNLTWYPSEFSKIRLQYNYDDRERIGVDHSVWLQFEFLLGAHAVKVFPGSLAGPGYLRALWVTRSSLTTPAAVTAMVQSAKAGGFNPLQLGLIWTFAAGGKLFAYQSGVLIVGYSYGHFDARDLLEVEATSVWQLDEQRGLLELYVATGDRGDKLKAVTVPVGQSPMKYLGFITIGQSASQIQ